MAADHYQLIFDGQLAEGFLPDAVRQNIARRFKLSEPQVESLFRSGEVVLKRGLDAETATRYQQAFLEAGAMVRVQAAAPSAPKPAQHPDASAAVEHPTRTQAAPTPTTDPSSVATPRTDTTEPAAKAASNIPPEPPAQSPPVTPSPEATAPAATGTAAARLPQRVEASAATLQLMPTGTPITDELEPDPPPPDTSHLSLTGGDDMSLSDCAPPEPPPPKLDLSGLKVEPADTDDANDPDADHR